MPQLLYIKERLTTFCKPSNMIFQNVIGRSSLYDANNCVQNNVAKNCQIYFAIHVTPRGGECTYLP